MGGGGGREGFESQNKNIHLKSSPEIRSREPGASLFIKVAPGSQNFT